MEEESLLSVISAHLEFCWNLNLYGRCGNSVSHFGYGLLCQVLCVSESFFCKGLTMCAFAELFTLAFVDSDVRILILYHL